MFVQLVCLCPRHLTMKMYCLYCGSIKDSLLSDVLSVCPLSVLQDCEVID